MTETTTLNDLGVSIQITIEENGAVVDISTATALEIILTKPTGAQSTKTAALYTDGSDGILQYSTVSGDIDQVGIWGYQAKITFSPTQVYYSGKSEFTVLG